jgi:haloalkane dehalogenase
VAALEPRLPALSGAGGAGPLPPDWLDRSLFPYDQRHVRLDGHDVAYVDEGTGPPVLMLHGNPTWSFVWRDVIAGLRDRFRCVAPDLPGFGFSTAAPGYGFRPEEHAAVIERFVAELGLDDATLMAQDWGGPIGLAVAGRHPGRFRALALANTWAWPVNGDLHFEAFSRVMGGPIGRRLILHRNVFVEWLVPAGTRKTGPDDAVMAAYRGPFPQPVDRIPTAVLPREIRASRAFLAGVEAGLAALAHLPVLLLWGDKDVAFRTRERRRFEALFPVHRTAVLEGAGHFGQEDAPAEIVAAVRDWADGA